MPLPVVSIQQMRDWEQATWAAGQTELEVIRRVGKAVAERVLSMTRPEDQVLILAGKGNNGQDARGAREHLAGRRVVVLDVSDPHAEVAKLNAMLSLNPALVVDGLFGIGLNRPLGSEWIQFIEAVNDSRCCVLAVDVPSGLNADTGEPQGAAIRADVTLTVGAPKAGMLLEPAWDYVGRLEVAADVGLAAPPQGGELRWTVPQDFSSFPPPRRVASHKGSYGHLAIVAGSLGYHGAAVLAARGAQRAQPGLVTLHTLDSVYQVVAAQLQSVMVSPWRPQTELGRPWSAVLAGPGLAAADVPEQLKATLRALWRESDLPVVVDASALDWLLPEPATGPGLRVITPHPGEAARLLGLTTPEVQGNRLQTLRRLSLRFGNAWVALKGHQTLVGRGAGQVYVNSSGNPYLAQGGSGDLLSGYVAGLIAQPVLQKDPLMVLRYAVWQHGAAADSLQATHRNWIVEDLASALGNGGINR